MSAFYFKDTVSYALGRRGNDACPEGFSPILDPNTCSAAYKAIFPDAKNPVYAKEENSKESGALCTCFGECTKVRSRFDGKGGSSAKGSSSKGPSSNGFTTDKVRLAVTNNRPNYQGREPTWVCQKGTHLNKQIV